MSTDPIDQWVGALQAGDPQAPDRLFELLYEQFKSKAHVLLRVGPKQTLCTTELVNETWMRLRGHRLPVESRTHYCNLAAKAMRQVLIDRARHRNAEKRGDGIQALTLRAADDVQGEDPFEILMLDQVMTALAHVDPRLAELAQLHLFGGLSIVEIAELTGTSERTTFRQWRTARMFLIKTIGG
jgi:RNA polymerase sigma factor (TIGR02999 family)